jgi:DNA-3-methyladenine glycosylase
LKLSGSDWPTLFTKLKYCRRDLIVLAPDPSLRLQRAFFAYPVVEVAKNLVGCLLRSRLGGAETSGVIVETEAYADATDLASHAARLKRGSVLMMSGEPGIAYIYRSHGIHTMLNFVAEPEGKTAAVLVRALEPVDGVDIMRQRRGVEHVELLCSGPGRLCQALRIQLSDHGTDVVTSDELWLEHGSAPASISVSGRIGISKDTNRPWRFFVSGSGYVSARGRVPTIEITSNSNGDTIS